MGRGRPSNAQELLADYLMAKPDRVLDIKLDGPAIRAMAAGRGMDRYDLPSAVRRLGEKRVLHPLQHGRWVLSPGAVPTPTPRLDHLELLADAVLRRTNLDYYCSWHSALWHHGLIDQQSRRLYVATTGRKRPVKLRMSTVQFVAVAERKFFGRVLSRDFEWPVWMAAPEKTIIDCLDQPHLAAPMPVIANALKRGWAEHLIDPDRLVADAIRFGNLSLNRRLGFFMDLFDIPGTEPLSLHLGRTFAVPLHPGHPPTAGHPMPVNRRWRVWEDPGTVGTALELK